MEQHFACNILGKTLKTLRSEVKQAVRAILTAPEMETAHLLLQKSLASIRGRHPGPWNAWRTVVMMLRRSWCCRRGTGAAATNHQRPGAPE